MTDEFWIGFSVGILQGVGLTALITVEYIRRQHRRLRWFRTWRSRC